MQAIDCLQIHRYRTAAEQLWEFQKRGSSVLKTNDCLRRLAFSPENGDARKASRQPIRSEDPRLGPIVLIGPIRNFDLPADI
jgi:hypothetical protein